MNVSVVSLDYAGYRLACVASVSGEFGSKERPRNGILGVLSARKMGREPKKKKEEGGRGEGRKRFLPSFPSPSPLFYSFHFSRCNSLLPNPTETLATQAGYRFFHCLSHYFDSMLVHPWRRPEGSRALRTRSRGNKPLTRLRSVYREIEIES